MSMLKRIIFASFLAVAMFSVATAQDSVNSVAQRSSVTITAVAFGDRIRITAPASVVQMHVEVFAAGGEKVLDQEIKNGNVFDWQLQSGQRLPAGRYVCVVTARSISGRLTKRLGAVKVDDQALSVEPADSAQLSAPQAQAIGLVEENSSWTVLGSDENQTSTVIAHDGTDGQLTRGQGALTFRVGDFFSGNDKEQMRLTEAGDLGIGTDNPRAKLDVAGDISARGTVRADRVEFADGTVQTSGLSGRKDRDGILVPNVAGTGTQNRIAKWTDNAGTLGDSLLGETAGGVELRPAVAGVGVNPTLTNFANVAGFAQVSFYPAAGANTNMSFSVVPRGTGAASNRAQFSIFNTDLSASPTNYEFAALRARGSDFVLGTGKSGTGVNRPFMFASGYLSDNTTNNGQFYLASNGNVGVGTTTPGAKLEVAGDTKVSNNLTVDTNTLFVNAANDQVGIGTSTPGSKLDVVGSINASGSLTGATGNISGNLTVDTSTLHVDAATNRVGIGTVTPTESLHVAGNGLVTGNLSVNGNLSVAGELSATLPAGSGNYIQNSTAEQSSSDFNISGNGTAAGTLSANIVSATTQYNFGADRVLGVVGADNTFAGVNAGPASPSPFGCCNSFFGKNAGAATVDGINNSFFGKNAGAMNTLGSNNSFFGLQAGENNTISTSNSFFGVQAGRQNTTGASNSFFGLSAGSFNLTGNNNTLIGYSANVGSNNLDHATAIGADAVVSTSNTIALGRSSGADAVLVPGNLTVSGTLTATLPTDSGSYIQNRASPTQATSDFNISGSGTAGGTLSANNVSATTQYNVGVNRVLAISVGNTNTFVGVGAGAANPTSPSNSFFGQNAGAANTTGGFNSFFGKDAGAANTTGSANSFFGTDAGESNTTGESNSFFGFSAGDSNTTGELNSFFGTFAGQANRGGFANSFFGASAGESNGLGTFNSFFGVSAGARNTGGFNNSFFGFSAGDSNINGFNNSFFGVSAGESNTEGTFNSFFGVSAGAATTTGTFNSFFGVSAGAPNTTGDSNSFFGTSAGNSNSTGSNNTVIGRFAFGTNTTGSNNTIIGGSADVGSNDLTFATALGANAVVNANDTIVLGKVAGTYGGAARPADTVRVPGKILAETNAGSAVGVGVGEYYRDNAIVAWARITASGTVGSDFGISAIAHTTTGIYTITLTASALASTFLIPVAIAEIDNAPTSAATLRIVSINQTSVNSFQVFINNGTGALVDNDFIFIATAR